MTADPHAARATGPGEGAPSRGRRRTERRRRASRRRGRDAVPARGGPDGTQVHVLGSAAPLCDGLGRRVGAVLVMRDVTERTRLVQAIRARTTAKERFFAHPSHELRTPVNAVLGYTSLLSGGDAGTLPSSAAQMVGYPACGDVERRLAPFPSIPVPTITLEGAGDGVVPATDGTSTAARFTGGGRHLVIPRVGHNLLAEAPRAFADAVWELASAAR